MKLTVFKQSLSLLMRLQNRTTTTPIYYASFSRTIWVSRYQKGKTSLDLNEARDDGFWGCSQRPRKQFESGGTWRARSASL